MGHTSPVPGIDPAMVTTPRQLRECLRGLKQRRGLSFRALEELATKLPRRDGRQPRLPRGTLNDLLAVKDTMPSNKVAFRIFLDACDISRADLPQWLTAWERASTADLAKPAGAIRVREARPRELGVHPSIQVEPTAADMPVYVPRDRDPDLREHVRAVGRRGGLVLLTGRSSVGKTRMLVEAINAELSDWWLLHPTNAAAVRLLAESPTPQTVVWLDELQNYLDQPGGLTAGVVRGLLTAGTVVVATMWPDEYVTRTALRTPGQDDPYANDRELLGLAIVIDVLSFSPAERGRAEDLAADDPRLRIALDTSSADVGVTEVLAAGPELVRRWENAPHVECYGAAVITAGLDAQRVGARAPLTVQFLTAAAPAYLSGSQQAGAPVDWVEQALRYAIEPVHGATACLIPVPAGMGEVAGYVTADYLHQHARKIRRAVLLPEVVWDALVEHHDPGDTYRLARSADLRGRFVDAITLARKAAAASDKSGARLLAELLCSHGRVDELRQRAVAGDRYAAERLAGLLAKQGRVDELIERAVAGDRTAAELLAHMFARAGGKIEDGVTLLRHCIDEDDEVGIGSLATILATYGRVDQAIALLKPHAEAGNDYLSGVLAGLFAKHNRVKELRQLADGGDRYAGELLVQLLAEQGQVDELEQRADGGKFVSVTLLAVTLLMELRARQGRTEEALALMFRAGGSHDAVVRLAEVLAEQGHLDEAVELMQSRAAPGDRYAAARLAVLRGKHGQVDQAIAELRQYADAGDPFAGMWLIELLAEHGRIGELEEEVAAGTPGAAKQLAALRQ